MMNPYFAPPETDAPEPAARWLWNERISILIAIAVIVMVFLAYVDWTPNWPVSPR